MKRFFIVFACLFAGQTETQAQGYGNNEAAGRYCDVGDARIYFEVYGSGEPVILLHGGLFGSIAEFSHLIPELEKDWMVIAISTRGHGKSEVGSRAMTYELQSEDFSKVIRQVTNQPAIVIGFSDGAIASYHLASKHPELVKRLIAAGGPLGLLGYTDKGRASLSAYDTPAELELMAPAFVKKVKATMEDDKWVFFCGSLASMWKQEHYINPADFRKIKCPVLLIAGDRDEYTATDHIARARDVLLDGQLAIIPGAGHTVFAERPGLMAKIILDFLRPK